MGQLLMIENNKKRAIIQNYYRICQVNQVLAAKDKWDRVDKWDHQVVQEDKADKWDHQVVQEDKVVKWDLQVDKVDNLEIKVDLVKIIN
jgi:hypothetical protein